MSIRSLGSSVRRVFRPSIWPTRTRPLESGGPERTRRHVAAPAATRRRRRVRPPPCGLGWRVSARVTRPVLRLRSRRSRRPGGAAQHHALARRADVGLSRRARDSAWLVGQRHVGARSCPVVRPGLGVDSGGPLGGLGATRVRDLQMRARRCPSRRGAMTASAHRRRWGVSLDAGVGQRASACASRLGLPSLLGTRPVHHPPRLGARDSEARLGRSTRAG